MPDRQTNTQKFISFYIGTKLVIAFNKNECTFNHFQHVQLVDMGFWVFNGHVFCSNVLDLFKRNIVQKKETGVNGCNVRILIGIRSSYGLIDSDGI